MRIQLWARSNRFQMRWKVRSLRWHLVAWLMSRVAAAMLPEMARWRNVHRVRVVKLRRQTLSAIQTLKVRPQPGCCRRLLQKMRRARIVVRCRLLSSNPESVSCRLSVPMAWQCGQGVILSRSAISTHSWSQR